MQPYKLTYAYALTLDSDSYDKEPIDMDTLNTKELLPVISSQNTTFKKMHTIKKKYEDQMNQLSENTKPKKKKNRKTVQYNGALLTVSTSMLTKFPKNIKELNAIIDNVMQFFDIKDYHIKEIHEIVMCLSDKYYEPFANWLNVGWALHNTHDGLFWTWLKFSQQSPKFNWDDIPGLLK